VSPDDDSHSNAELEKANAQLTESLERCRQLLSHCREQLAANSNDRDDDGEVEERTG
jgi:hypothetical protein